MDTTPEYIKMCEKAKNLLSFWKPNKGYWFKYDNYIHCIGRGVLEYHNEKESEGCEIIDFYNNDKTNYDTVEGKAFYFYHGYDGSNDIGLKDVIPLWTQDQLQAMLKKSLPDKEIMFHDFCLHSEYAYEKRFLLSFEQLWLAFVMAEKFNKIWNGKKWVKKQRRKVCK